MTEKKMSDLRFAEEPTSSHLPVEGLSSTEVQKRVQAGQINKDASVHTRSYKEIFYSNIFTLFNAINVLLAIIVVFTGSYKNMLFMMVIVLNVIIGIVQEIRSKKTTDKLSIVAASKAHAVRDGKLVFIDVEDLVVDDVIQLGRGDQVPADCEVVYGSCDVNESLLTGESNLIKKEIGSELMSGSFVNAGVVFVKIHHVGKDNYAAKITAEAKAHKVVNSEIMNSLNGIIKFVSIAIFPVGAALFIREHFISGTDWIPATLSTVSALVGMIPEGLILLTSTALAVSVVRLAKSKVLVQQLYCIETLARVDTLCLDKTGTITTGAMEVAGLELVEVADQRMVAGAGQVEVVGGTDTAGAAGATQGSQAGGAGAAGATAIQGSAASAEGLGAPTSPGSSVSLEEVKRAFAAIARADEDPNETACAMLEYFKGMQQVPAVKTSIPFSSDKKWSGALLEDGSAYVMGAAQFILKDAFEMVREQAQRLAEDARILLLAKVDAFDGDGAMVGTPVPLGFICIHDQIRSTAAQTIQYFKDQGVTVKVISGDDPRTVSGIAHKVGVENAEQFIDATTLKTDEDIKDNIERYSVFGRVKPEQKKAFVLALQEKGHTVAMTGDGVNDTLALKASDCSVAMASGSDAARNVAQLVLVDNDFASMPKVVAEGRRCINNLQRSASLFLVKTLFSMALALLFIILPWQYPFQPIQMTLISAFTIGLPSFVLALEPNKDRIRGKFLNNAVVRSIPGAITVVGSVLIICFIGYTFMNLSYSEVSSMCVITVAWVGINLVARLCIPFTPIRGLLLVVCVVGVFLGCTFLDGLFGIASFDMSMTVIVVIMAVTASLVFNLLFNVFDLWHKKELAKLV